MNIVAGQPVRGRKFGNALAKQALLSLQSLGIAFFGAEFHQEAPHERGHRRVLLGGDQARTPVNVIIK